MNISASRRVLVIARYSRPSSSLTPWPVKYSSVRSSRRGVAVEVGDGLTDDVVRLVDQHGDVEAGDGRVLQHGRERLGVVLGRREPAQPAVGVLVGGDHQRPATGGHGSRRLVTADERLDELGPLRGGRAAQLEGVAVDGDRDLVRAGARPPSQALIVPITGDEDPAAAAQRDQPLGQRARRRRTSHPSGGGRALDRRRRRRRRASRSSSRSCRPRRSRPPDPCPDPVRGPRAAPRRRMVRPARGDRPEASGPSPGGRTGLSEVSATVPRMTTPAAPLPSTSSTDHWTVHNRKLPRRHRTRPCEEWVGVRRHQRGLPRAAGRRAPRPDGRPRRPGRPAVRGPDPAAVRPVRRERGASGGAPPGAPGRLDPPVVGRFTGGRGVFEGDDVIGRAPGDRCGSSGSPSSRLPAGSRSFSYDGGGDAGALNWVMRFTRRTP